MPTKGVLGNSATVSRNGVSYSPMGRDTPTGYYAASLRAQLSRIGVLGTSRISALRPPGRTRHRTSPPGGAVLVLVLAAAAVVVVLVTAPLPVAVGGLAHRLLVLQAGP